MIRNWIKILNKVMQVGFHPLENKWVFVFWLLLFCKLHSTKQSKAKNTKLTSSPTKMQQADAAVSNREAMCMKVSTLRVIQRMTQQKILIGTNIGFVNKKSCNFTKIRKYFHETNFK